MGPKKTKKWLSPTLHPFTIHLYYQQTTHMQIFHHKVLLPQRSAQGTRGCVPCSSEPSALPPFVSFPYLLAMAPRQSLIRWNGDEKRLSQRSLAADHHSISITPLHFQFTSSFPKTQYSQKWQRSRWKYVQGMTSQLNRKEPSHVEAEWSGEEQTSDGQMATIRAHGQYSLTP